MYILGLMFDYWFVLFYYNTTWSTTIKFIRLWHWNLYILILQNSKVYHGEYVHYFLLACTYCQSGKLTLLH